MKKLLVAMMVLSILSLITIAHAGIQVQSWDETAWTGTTAKVVEKAVNGEIVRIKIDVGSSTFTQAIAVVTAGEGMNLYAPTTNGGTDVTIHGIRQNVTDGTGTAVYEYQPMFDTGGVQKATITNNVFCPTYSAGVALKTWSANLTTNNVKVWVTYKDFEVE